MPRRGLLLALVALSALLALPAFAGAQDWGSGLFDETEPDATVTKVKVNAHKGLAKVYFVGSDPVDAPEDLSYDCEVDGGDHGGSSDDGSDDDESPDEDSNDDESDDEDALHAARSKSAGETEYDCDSPWTVQGLEPGKHTVEIVAWDEEWNEDSTPAQAQFKVKKKH
ncbi:MAG TPA: hypothetical protein VEK39_08925 [Solirubrobacterales bacterium]|nr:hypothetical protein [Solirubrobacterales bacterium]